MKTDKTLSVVIVNYNTAPFLVSCLDSLFSSASFSRLLEVVVVNNGSDDSLSGIPYVCHPSVRILENQRNEGYAAANNQAVRLTSGAYVLFLNPDTTVSPETISLMLSYMDDSSCAGAATCRVVLPNGEIDDACHRGFPTPLNAFFFFSGLARFFPHSRFFNGYHLGYRYMDRVHSIDSCSGAFMLVRRRAGEQVGWFDEDYFWYGEDIDFCFRLHTDGWKVMFLPFGDVLHYRGVSSGIKKHSSSLSSASDETRRRATIARFEAMKIFYRKHYEHAYPSIVKHLVFSGIGVKEWLAIRTYANRD